MVMVADEVNEERYREECRAEITKRIARYKKAPTTKAMVTRLSKFCGGDWAVELHLMQMVRSGLLRVTDGVYYLPQKWDALSDLGHR